MNYDLRFDGEKVISLIGNFWASLGDRNCLRGGPSSGSGPCCSGAWWSQGGIGGAGGFVVMEAGWRWWSQGGEGGGGGGGACWC